MASPFVRRQILSLSPSTLRTTPPVIHTTTTSTAGGGLLPSITNVVSDVTSLLGPVFSTSSSQSTSSTGPSSVPPLSTTLSSVSSVSSTATPSLLTAGPDGPTTITQTTSATAPPSTGTSEAQGKSFLENKPLSGFVFGFAGLAVLILVFIAVTSFVRRQHRKRLLAEASTFSFDPKVVEDGASDEKHPHSELVGHHHDEQGQSDYPSASGFGRGFPGVGTGRASGPRPAHSPRVPAYIPQDYVGYDSGHLPQYHHMGNVPARYNPTPNPYDVYAPTNGGGYPNGQDQRNPYNVSGSNGDSLSMTGPGLSVPRRLQPGVRPANGPTFTPLLSNENPPQNRTLPIPLTTSPPPTYLQPSPLEDRDLPRLPTPGSLAGTFGRRGSVDDDAYGGAFLGPESPPLGQSTLQVANV